MGEGERSSRGRFWQGLPVSQFRNQLGPRWTPSSWTQVPGLSPPAFRLTDAESPGPLSFSMGGPSGLYPGPAAPPCRGILRPSRVLEARLTFRWMGKDRSCWRGPSSVCSTLTSSEVESTTRASALRIAIWARVQGPRPLGKGSSSAPPSAPRTTSTSGELARAPDPPLLAPRRPPPSSRPGPGRALRGPVRRAGAADTWSGSRGIPGSPGPSPQPHSCCSSCSVCRATIWWLMEATKGAGLAIASAGGSARSAGRCSSERERRGRLGSPGSHFPTRLLALLPLEGGACPAGGGQRWPPNSYPNGRVRTQGCRRHCSRCARKSANAERGFFLFSRALLGNPAAWCRSIYPQGYPAPISFEGCLSVIIHALGAGGGRLKTYPEQKCQKPEKAHKRKTEPDPPPSLSQP